MSYPQRKRSIVIVSPHLYGGGSERNVSYLSLSAPEYVDLHIILLKRTISYPVNHKVYVVGDYQDLYSYFKTLLNFNRLLFKLKPDAVLFVGKNKAITFALFNPCKNKILRVQNYNFEPYTPYKFKKFIFNVVIMKFLVRLLTKRIIGISKPIKTKLIKEYSLPASKIVTIYNPCDVMTIQNMINEPLSDDDYDVFDKKQVLVTVGRLVVAKGHWHLIRVFKKINEYVENSSLIILGDGPLKNSLERLVRDLKLNDKVF
ncbi:MAG: glycosyltransferase, partial [Nitrososphaerota archaeon]